MNRRELLFAFIAIPAVSTDGSATPSSIGYMDVHRWRAEGYFPNARVLLNGVDITDRCRWFDDTTGEACCNVMPTHLPTRIADSGVRTEILTGVIEVSS